MMHLVHKLIGFGGVFMILPPREEIPVTHVILTETSLAILTEDGHALMTEN